MIAPEHGAALILDGLPSFQLRAQVGSQHIGQPERRSDVLPGILIYLTQQKSLAIRALVVEDPGAVDVGGVVDKQGAAFAAGNVFSLVEALGGKPAPASQGFAAPPTQQAVGIVFDDSDIGPVDRKSTRLNSSHVAI